MTFMSIFVEKHSSEESAKAPYVSGASHEVFGSVNAYTWPHPVYKFAEENGLAIDWVDNCWIRVCVDGAQLKAFLAAGESTLGDHDKIGDSDWFVINEEEF